MDTWEFHDRVRNAPNLAAFSERIESSLGELGFHQHAYVAFLQKTEPEIIDNYPAGYREHFIENDYVYIDPVLMGTRRSLLPFKWSRSSEVFSETLPLSPKQKQILEEGSEFGINRGIAVPIHLLRGSFGVLVANSDLREPEFDRLWEKRQLEIQLFALHIHEAYVDLAFPKIENNIFKISPREREILQLLAVGRGLYDISETLALSLDTVRNYLRSARRKLGVTNTMHAVVKAVHHGVVNF